MSLYAFLGMGVPSNFAFIFLAISTPTCLSHRLYISALLPLSQPPTVTSSFSDGPKYTEDFSHFCLPEEFSKICASNSEHFSPHSSSTPNSNGLCHAFCNTQNSEVFLHFFSFLSAVPTISWVGV